MKMMWNYGAIGLLTLAAAAVVATGEPANAELKLVESATAAATVGATAHVFPRLTRFRYRDAGSKDHGAVTSTTAPTPRSSIWMRLGAVLLGLFAALLLVLALFPWDALREPLNRYVSERPGASSRSPAAWTSTWAGAARP